MNIIVKFLSLCSTLCVPKLVLCDDHWSQREEILSKEKSIALGASIKLHGLEECVNQGLMMMKYNELDQALENPSNFYPSVNFLKAVKYIDTSDVYNFIRKMPKGAALHLHDTAMASPQYLYKLTFTENLFVCWTKTNRLLLNFFLFHVDNRCEWVPLEIAREEEGFEDLLQSQLSMATSVYKASTSSQVAWNELLGTFATIEGLISYKPIFTSYLGDVLTRLYEDNVMYVELRTMLLPVYDLEGNDYNPSDVATLLKEVLEDFQCSHQDFLGGKIIYTPSRMVDYAWMDRYMEIMDELSSEHPDFVAGFDLMGQEDLSYPLSKFVGSFQGMKNRVSFFFSAGETSWIGSNADLNMYDAILLHPARIGHAFTLFSHPEILKIVKKENIAIELCPISNQMMMLVSDLRNHPGKFLISHGYPVVVSSDNPGFWGARALSHDWYMVFMAMADREADLRLLKQLAINSLQYSAINDKKKALKVWAKKWKNFISQMEHMCIEESPEAFNETAEEEYPDGTDKGESIKEPEDEEQITSTEYTGSSRVTYIQNQMPPFIDQTHQTNEIAVDETEQSATSDLPTINVEQTSVEDINVASIGTEETQSVNENEAINETNDFTHFPENSTENTSGEMSGGENEKELTSTEGSVPTGPVDEGMTVVSTANVVTGGGTSTENGVTGEVTITVDGGTVNGEGTAVESGVTEEGITAQNGTDSTETVNTQETISTGRTDTTGTGTSGTVTAEGTLVSNAVTGGETNTEGTIDANGTALTEEVTGETGGMTATGETVELTATGESIGTAVTEKTEGEINTGATNTVTEGDVTKGPRAADTVGVINAEGTVVNNANSTGEDVTKGAVRAANTGTTNAAPEGTAVNNANSTGEDVTKGAVRAANTGTTNFAPKETAVNNANNIGEGVTKGAVRAANTGTTIAAVSPEGTAVDNANSTGGDITKGAVRAAIGTTNALISPEGTAVDKVNSTTTAVIGEAAAKSANPTTVATQVPAKT